MDAAPTPSGTSDPRDPLSSVYLSGANYRPSSDAASQPLAVGDPPVIDPTDPSSSIDLRSVYAAPKTWQDGQVKGKLYRFVTSGDDTACGTACPGSEDYRRISVAVTVTAPVNAITKPIVVSTEIGNPSDAKVTTVAGTPPEVRNYKTYYPYDTPTFVSSGVFNTTRVDQTASHTRRDTQIKPDLMGEDPTPDPNCTDTYPNCNPPTPVVVPTYKYTTDTGGSTPPAYQFGAGIKKSGACAGGGPDKEHMWVTNTLTAPLNLTGNATADIYTMTMDGLSGPGRLCVRVYDVAALNSSDGKVTGTPLLIGNAQTTEQNPWPITFDTGETLFDFRFLDPTAVGYTVPTGHRLAVYFTTADKLLDGVTATKDLAIMYDHPDYLTSFGFEAQ
jgi:hypothetical protein